MTSLHCVDILIDWLFKQVLLNNDAKGKIMWLYFVHCADIKAWEASPIAEIVGAQFDMAFPDLPCLSNWEIQGRSFRGGFHFWVTWSIIIIDTIINIVWSYWGMFLIFIWSQPPLSSVWLTQTQTFTRIYSRDKIFHKQYRKYSIQFKMKFSVIELNVYKNNSCWV